MKFNSAILKLTLLYGLITMLISICFSIAIYNISLNEIGQGLGRQNLRFRELPNNRMNLMMDQLEQIRNDEIESSNNNLKTNLIYYNLLILILSSAGSYLLAKRTIRPIEDMVESQHRFTADASHELKTPLTAMKTEIEVSLRDKKLDLKGSKEILGSNLEEISKLELLSSALLNLAKYQNETHKEYKRIILNDVLAEAHNKTASLSEKKNIQVNLSSLGGEINILGDKTSLVELFVILLDNAIKYSPKKSDIDISTYLKDSKPVVSIKDAGYGIKASDIPHIFDRFYRADYSRNKERASGYGLGLSIAKRIVDLHQGQISVKSEVGSGSEFIVKL